RVSHWRYIPPVPLSRPVPRRITGSHGARGSFCSWLTPTGFDCRVGGRLLRGRRGRGGALALVLALPGGVLQQHGDDDDRALGDVLDVGVEVVLREDAVEDREDQNTDECPEETAAPAREQGAADDDGRDGVECVEQSVDRKS